MSEEIDAVVLLHLRDLARQGQTPADVLRALRRLLGPEAHIVTVLRHFKLAFGLGLADVKPIAALTRNNTREVEDEPLLNSLLGEAISRRRQQWEQLTGPVAGSVSGS